MDEMISVFYQIHRLSLRQRDEPAGRYGLLAMSTSAIFSAASGFLRGPDPLPGPDFLARDIFAGEPDSGLQPQA